MRNASIPDTSGIGKEGASLEGASLWLQAAVVRDKKADGLVSELCGRNASKRHAVEEEGSELPGTLQHTIVLIYK